MQYWLRVKIQSGDTQGGFFFSNSVEFFGPGNQQESVEFVEQLLEAAGKYNMLITEVQTLSAKPENVPDSAITQFTVDVNQYLLSIYNSDTQVVQMALKSTRSKPGSKKPRRAPVQ